MFQEIKSSASVFLLILIIILVKYTKPGMSHSDTVKINSIEIPAIFSNTQAQVQVVK
jgi:hypothetical protein